MRLSRLWNTKRLRSRGVKCSKETIFGGGTFVRSGVFVFLLREESMTAVKHRRVKPGA